MSANPYEANARMAKAIRIEWAVRSAGCRTVDDLDALDSDGRRNAEAVAGVARASAETWSMVRELFASYDEARRATEAVQ